MPLNQQKLAYVRQSKQLISSFTGGCAPVCNPGVGGRNPGGAAFTGSWAPGCSPGVAGPNPGGGGSTLSFRGSGGAFTRSFGAAGSVGAG